MKNALEHTTIVMIGLLCVPLAAHGQQAFRNPRLTARIATTRQAVDSLESTSRALRKVLVDSTLGTPLWVEFSADQQAVERRAGSVDGVLAAFLARHRQLLGIETVTDLREVSRVTHDGMVHVRYRQHWRGIRIQGGELRVHLRGTSGGYVVESANGRVYADVDAPQVAAVTPAMALETGATRLAGEGVLQIDSASGGSLTIRPFPAGYRLVYTIVGTREGVVVDAVSGEVLRASARDPSSASPLPAGRRMMARGARSRPITRSRDAGGVAPPAGYVNGSGRDALNQLHPPGSFLVYFNNADHELRSNQLNPYMSEVIVVDYEGQNMEPCSSGGAPGYSYPLATYSTANWPELDDPRQHQVSGMVNGVAVGKFYRDSLGRWSYDNGNPGSHVFLCVNGASDPARAAVSFGADNSLGFDRSVPGTARKGAVAARDIVTHEFTHNVTRDENVAQNWKYEPYGTPEHETAAMNEGLADYFGARHKGSACHGADAFGFCSRNLASTPTYAVGQGLSAHNFGVVFSSALWQVASLSSALGKDVDHATYDGMRFYMLEGAQMRHSREAVVRAAQDRQHANLNLTAVVPHLENAFASRGIGYPAVALQHQESWIYGCEGWKFTVAVGAANRRYQILFESGTGINNDQSVANVQYSVQVEPFAFRYGNQTFEFPASAVGGHRVDDGHAHDLRVRFNDGQLGVAGIILDYYLGYDAGGLCAVLPEFRHAPLLGESDGRLAARPPAKLTVRQVVASGNAVGVELSGGSGAGSGSRPGLAAQIARSGIMTLDYGVPVAGSGHTTIHVYDLRGRLVRTLSQGWVGAGWARVTWDGRDDGGDDVAPGVYLALVRAGGETVRTRLIVPSR
jgi:hypothetical protein